MSRRPATLIAGAALVAFLAATPMAGSAFQIQLVTQGVVWAILGLSVWLLLRKLDLPSFGHAAFFGVAAYTAGLAVTRWEVGNVFVALGIAVGVTCLVALPMALIAGRLKGVSFLLITLAFAEMLHALAQRWDVVGGSDGLVGVIRPDAAPLPLELSEPTGFFYFAVAFLAVVGLLLLVIVRSPFGGVLVGVRESEDRMSALGYNPVLYRIAAFVLSAGIAATAGVLDAYLTRFVSPDELGALVSARALLIVAIATSSMLGVAVVGIALTILEDVLSTSTDRWLGILGVLYVLVALVGTDRVRAGALWAHMRALLRRRPPAVREEAKAS